LEIRKLEIRKLEIRKLEIRKLGGQYWLKGAVGNFYSISQKRSDIFGCVKKKVFCDIFQNYIYILCKYI
jgi:hypothetical protein